MNAIRSTAHIVTTSMLAVLLILATGRTKIYAASSQRPNFVFILIDDLRYDTLSCAGHPFVRTPNIDRLASAGVRFGNAFVTTSLCSPSRAAFLTGTYADTNTVRVNEKNDPDPAIPTFPQVLQSAGYETAFIGKWHMRMDADPRPGYDYWFSFRGQGEYNDPLVNINGRQKPVSYTHLRAHET